MDLLSLSGPTSLPNWMLVFSFVASLVLTILAVIEGVCRSLRKATLELALTREVFYRLLDSGECLYANAVLVAYDSGALVQDMQASLKKRNGATKTFTLRIAQIGEKYRAPDGTYQFSFHSTSPLAFVPENNPQRMVYICEQESYAAATRSSFFQFTRGVYQLKAQYEAVQAPDEGTVGRLRSDLVGLLDATCAQVMDQMQIEPGEYELSISLKYRQKGKMLPRFHSKSAISSVRFSVEQNVRDYFRYMLRAHLEGRASNVLFNQTNPAPAPEYTPTNIEEMARGAREGELEQSGAQERGLAR